MFYTLSDMDVSDKKVIVRTGFDVPVDERGNVVNDKRIRSSIPTITYLLEHGAKQIILMWHMGRPKSHEEHLKTDKVALKLSQLIGKQVIKVDDWGEEGIPQSRIVALENVRFNSAEKSTVPEVRDAFGRELANLADIYVNDAFSNSHRSEQASMTSVCKYIPSCAGLGLEKEVRVLSKLLKEPKRPYVAILGGGKVSDKIKLIEALLPKVDSLLIGGAMIFTFYKAMGKEIGTSKLDEDAIGLVKTLMTDKKIVLPTDVVVGDSYENSSYAKNTSVDDIGKKEIGLDIGEDTVKTFKDVLKSASTIVWNGPFGKYEEERFSRATNQIAAYIAHLDATTIIGGGDSATAIEKSGYQDKVTHISEGGGAFIEYLEKGTLGAIEALQENYMRFKNRRLKRP